MQKGFTLIELLAVIVILGVVLMLTVPSVLGVIERSKQSSYDMQVSNIIKAAKVYMAEKGKTISSLKIIGGTYYVTLSELNTNGYIETPIKNPQTNENFSETNVGVLVTKTDTNYTYNFTLYRLDISGANAPVLASNMIPIYYDSTTSVWKKADITNTDNNYKWYDYNGKMWANAVTVSSANRATYLAAENGTIIPSADILTYMVWIPRYKYHITTSGTTTPSSINIVFENSIPSKSTGNAITTYRTHSGFTFGEKELLGLWIGKFEISADPSTNCYMYTSPCNLTTITPRIKPNVYLWGNASISTFYTIIKNMENPGNIYGYVNTEVDMHMIKNEEWGAAAYLAYSNYGKNDIVWINPDSTLKTGKSGDREDAPGTTTTYDYDNVLYGVKASTTGNVYGIYDMSGGALEYTMSNYNSLVTLSEFVSFPETKYYNLYTTTTASTACSGGICYGHALSETSNWHQDYNNPVYNTYPWYVRGGYFNNTSAAGIFSYTWSGGNPLPNNSTRVVQTQL